MYLHYLFSQRNNLVTYTCEFYLSGAAGDLPSTSSPSDPRIRFYIGDFYV